MLLDNAQLVTLKNAINAEVDAVIVNALAINDMGVIADWYNEDSTDYVWRTTTPTDEIMDVVLWKRMTPEAVADTTQIYGNRALKALSKATVLSALLSQNEISSGRANIRTGIKDSLSELPTQEDGSEWLAGATPAIDVMKRFATRAEALYATGNGLFATPSDLVVEGDITFLDVVKALNS